MHGKEREQKNAEESICCEYLFSRFSFLESKILHLHQRQIVLVQINTLFDSFTIVTSTDYAQLLLLLLTKSKRVTWML